MLILSRKARQVVRIGSDSVTIMRVRGGQVRLGIHAPRELPVDREEVRIRKDEESRHTDISATDG